MYAVHSLPQREPSLTQPGRSRLQLIHVQHLIDQVKEMSGGAVNAVQTLCQPLRLIQPGARNGSHPHNRIQRRPHIMAHS